MTSVPLSERKRSVDLNNFSDAEIEELSQKIGNLVSEKVRNCVIECQKVLQIYGMDIYLQYNLHPAGMPPPILKTKNVEADDQDAADLSLKEEQTPVTVKKKRGRPKKEKA
jgi:hypothetical protein